MMQRRSTLFWTVILLLIGVSTLCLYGVSSPLGPDRTLLPNQSLGGRPLMEQVTESAITGGRAQGGTFSRPAPAPSLPSPSSSRRYESDEYDYESPSRSYPRTYSPAPTPAPIFIPYPSPTPGYRSSPLGTEPNGGGVDLGLIFILLILGLIVLPIIFNYIRLAGSQPNRAGSLTGGDELTNDIVTVTQLQVALLAEARSLQQNLNQLATQADLSTAAGLSEFLRETVLALLRFPEYWTHVRVRSQTLNTREAGSRLFERLSLEERSKFRLETLVNLGGQVQRRSGATAITATQADPAAYIVVTLLLGTADDQPLLAEVRSTEELKQALQRLGAISSDYLLIYELLWSPQDERDSLSREELIAQYPELVQI